MAGWRWFKHVRFLVTVPSYSWWYVLTIAIDRSLRDGWPNYLSCVIYCTQIFKFVKCILYINAAIVSRPMQSLYVQSIIFIVQF